MFFRVRPSDPITNLIPPNDLSGPNYPRNPLFSEKYCIFRKSILSSRILYIAFLIKNLGASFEIGEFRGSCFNVTLRFSFSFVGGLFSSSSVSLSRVDRPFKIKNFCHFLRERSLGLLCSRFELVVLFLEVVNIGCESD